MGSLRYYIQSAYAFPDEEKRSQEIRPFRKIDDSFKKIVITKELVPAYYDEYGILTLNIYDFLLAPDSVEKNIYRVAATDQRKSKLQGQNEKLMDQNSFAQIKEPALPVSFGLFKFERDRQGWFFYPLQFAQCC